MSKFTVLLSAVAVTASVAACSEQDFGMSPAGATDEPYLDGAKGQSVARGVAIPVRSFPKGAQLVRGSMALKVHQATGGSPDPVTQTVVFSLALAELGVILYEVQEDIATAPNPATFPVGEIEYDGKMFVSNFAQYEEAESSAWLSKVYDAMNARSAGSGDKARGYEYRIAGYPDFEVYRQIARVHAEFCPSTDRCVAEAAEFLGNAMGGPQAAKTAMPSVRAGLDAAAKTIPSPSFTIQERRDRHPKFACEPLDDKSCSALSAGYNFWCKARAEHGRSNNCLHHENRSLLVNTCSAAKVRLSYHQLCAEARMMFYVNCLDDSTRFDDAHQKAIAEADRKAADCRTAFFDMLKCPGGKKWRTSRRPNGSLDYGKFRAQRPIDALTALRKAFNCDPE